MSYICLNNEEIHELTNSDPNTRSNQKRMINKIGIIICIAWTIVAVHICLFGILASVLEMADKTAVIIGGIFMISCVIVLCLAIRSFWKQSNDGWVTIPNDVLMKKLEEHNEMVRQAEQGDADMQCQLGMKYLFGLFPVSQNHTESVKWLRIAAEQEHAVAQYNLGVCHYNGDGIPEDKAEAIRLFRKAAEQAHPPAQYNLGVCYANGDSVSQDYAEAVKWYQRAAELDDAAAQHNLGVCYFTGEGISQDFTEAVRWYRRAAAQGQPEAQCKLGACCYNGKGTQKNEAEGIHWIIEAAKQGNIEAIDLLRELDGR